MITRYAACDTCAVGVHQVITHKQKHDLFWSSYVSFHGAPKPKMSGAEALNGKRNTFRIMLLGCTVRLVERPKEGTLQRPIPLNCFGEPVK